ncbi:MAG TPA: histidine kinase dimerization/phospho-acceptor domain-containing protein [Chloroflexota bacterium]|nr:histidine kinase dimerization/phospho-acceptor domain-containing protein [Chloroflexota bacterium]
MLFAVGAAMAQVGRNGHRVDVEMPVREREDSVARVCHKLRTPLTSAMGFIQLALRDAQRGNSASQLQSLEMVDQQLRRMAGMIDELAENTRR